LSKVLATLDAELARLDYRRRHTLNALIKSRAKTVSFAYSNARQLEIRRMRQWKTLKDVREFDQRKPR
jgi:hypothetical protein